MFSLILAVALGGAMPSPTPPTDAKLVEWERHLDTTLRNGATTDERIFAFQRLAWEGAYQMIPEIRRLRAEVARLKETCDK